MVSSDGGPKSASGTPARVNRRTVLKGVAASVAACGLPFGVDRAAAQPVAWLSTRKGAAGTLTTPISKVIIVMFENHTFDNFFGSFPGANGVQSPPAPNPMMSDINHSHAHYLASFNGGKLNGFNSYGVVSYSQDDVPTLWSYAEKFGLSDNYFTAAAANSTPNHIFMIAAQSGGIFETGPENGTCGMPANYLMPSMTADGTAYLQYPCLDINSVPAELEQAGLSWKYYYANEIWNAPGFISNLAGGPNTHIDSDLVINDIQNGKLADVTWVCPSGLNDDHPSHPIGPAQNFLADVVNATMASKYWSNVAIWARRGIDRVIHAAAAIV
jgi:phospholipase C